MSADHVALNDCAELRYLRCDDFGAAPAERAVDLLDRTDSRLLHRTVGGPHEGLGDVFGTRFKVLAKIIVVRFGVGSPMLLEVTEDVGQ